MKLGHRNRHRSLRFTSLTRMTARKSPSSANKEILSPWMSTRDFQNRPRSTCRSTWENSQSLKSRKSRPALNQTCTKSAWQGQSSKGGQVGRSTLQRACRKWAGCKSLWRYLKNSTWECLMMSQMLSQFRTMISLMWGLVWPTTRDSSRQPDLDSRRIR